MCVCVDTAVGRGFGWNGYSFAAVIDFWWQLLVNSSFHAAKWLDLHGRIAHKFTLSTL